MNTSNETTNVTAAVANHLAKRFTGQVDERTAFSSRAKVLQGDVSPQAQNGIRRFVTFSAAFIATATAIALLVWPQSISVVADHVRLSESGAFEAGLEGAALSFSDGSRLRVTPGASGQVQRLDRHGADVLLVRGRIEMQVAKRKGARWSVSAGPYHVHVTGTRFGVAWNETEQRFSITMFEGKVSVDGPGLETPRALVAGESLDMAPPQPRPSMVPTPTALPAAPPVPPERPALPPVAKPLPRPAKAETVRADWALQVAQGQYKAVLADAQRRNVTHVLARGSLPELAALADAARYAGESDLARRALQAQRRRFATSAQAVMATYLLGRLAEDEGQLKEAVRWYDQYLASPGQRPLAEESLGRKMLSLERAARIAEAREIAHLYQKQYPHGAFFDAATRIQSLK